MTQLNSQLLKKTEEIEEFQPPTNDMIRLDSLFESKQGEIPPTWKMMWKAVTFDSDG